MVVKDRFHCIDVPIRAGGVHPVHIHGFTPQIVDVGFPLYDPDTSVVVYGTPDISSEGGFGRVNNWTDPSWAGGRRPWMLGPRAPRKDTVGIPVGGYLVMRFRADSAGKILNFLSKFLFEKTKTIYLLHICRSLERLKWNSATGLLANLIQNPSYWYEQIADTLSREVFLSYDKDLYGFWHTKRGYCKIVLIRGGPQRMLYDFFCYSDKIDNNFLLFRFLVHALSHGISRYQRLGRDSESRKRHGYDTGPWKYAQLRQLPDHGGRIF